MTEQKCYEQKKCVNAKNPDECLECERNFDNWHEYNDNFVPMNEDAYRQCVADLKRVTPKIMRISEETFKVTARPDLSEKQADTVGLDKPQPRQPKRGNLNVRLETNR